MKVTIEGSPNDIKKVLQATYDSQEHRKKIGIYDSVIKAMTEQLAEATGIIKTLIARNINKRF